MSKEQKQLLLKAQESLTAAKILVDNDLLAVAASRVYYTMFYVAQAFLLEEDLSFSSHSAVISNFGRLFAKTQRVPTVFHRFLINAQEKRTEADYDLNPEITSNDLSLMLEQAQEMLTFALQSLNNI
jgi:uncharacterized protein (UPF0332 family)